MRRECRACQVWVVFQGDEDVGWCHLWPTKKKKAANDFCGQFCPRPPGDDVLATDLEMLPAVSDRTRRICWSLGLRQVGDVYLVGRAAIVLNGRPEKQTIHELASAMRVLGVLW